MRLMLDVDGVLANFQAEALRIARELWPDREFNDNDWTHFRPWDTECALPINSEAEFHKIYRHVRWDRLKPLPEIDKIRTIAEKADYVRVVTARPIRGDIQDATRKWLDEHEIPYRDIIYAPNGSKYRWAQGMTHIMDDCDSEVEKVLSKFPKIKVIPIARLHNTQAELSSYHNGAE